MVSPNSNKKSYTLRLFGKKYSIMSKDDEAFVSRVAAVSERKIRELMTVNGNISLETAAVISLLQLSEELLHLQEEHNRLLRELEDAKK